MTGKKLYDSKNIMLFILCMFKKWNDKSYLFSTNISQILQIKVAVVQFLRCFSVWYSDLHLLASQF
jgi:hypothetical protein